MPRLPQEVIDLIVDELSCDKTALIAVSRLSRSWVPRSRKYLFRVLRPLSYSRLLHFRFRFALPAQTVEYLTQWFIDLCSHPLSTIPNAGATHFELTAYSQRDAGKERYPTVKPKNLSAFIMLLSWLSERSEMPGGKQGLKETNGHKLFWNVRHLILSFVGTVDSTKWLEKVLIPSPFPRVTELIIDGGCQAAQAQKSFPNMISSFTSLRELSFGGAFHVIYKLPSGSLSTESPFPLSLTHVEVLGSPASLGMLASSSALTHLSITITFPVVDYLCNMINQFLESSTAVNNGRLQNCKLVIPPDIVEVIEPLSDLIHFHKIPSWTIEVAGKALLNADIATIPNLTKLVLQNSGACHPFLWISPAVDVLLSELVVFPGLREVEIPIYEPLQEAQLSRRCQHMLRRLDEIEQRVSGDIHAVETRLRSILPMCNEKGLLKVTHVSRSIWEF